MSPWLLRTAIIAEQRPTHLSGTSDPTIAASACKVDISFGHHAKGDTERLPLACPALLWEIVQLKAYSDETTTSPRTEMPVAMGCGREVPHPQPWPSIRPLRRVKGSLRRASRALDPASGFPQTPAGHPISHAENHVRTVPSAKPSLPQAMEAPRRARDKTPLLSLRFREP